MIICSRRAAITNSGMHVFFNLTTIRVVIADYKESILFFFFRLLSIEWDTYLVSQSILLGLTRKFQEIFSDCYQKKNIFFKIASGGLPLNLITFLNKQICINHYFIYFCYLPDSRRYLRSFYNSYIKTYFFHNKS